MTTKNVTLRTVVGRPLTYEELDNNFKALDQLTSSSYENNRDPESTDDETEGFSAGSLWINQSDSRYFLCLNAAQGNATWKRIFFEEDFAAVSTSNSYSDLNDTPDLAPVALSNSYSDLDHTPNLAPVATGGSYNDLYDLPTVIDGGSY